MKVAIVIGHTEQAKGATSPVVEQEWDYNKKVAEQLVLLNPKRYKVFYHKQVGKYDYYKQQVATMTLVNKEDFDLVIELHYNSFNAVSNGTETLYYKGSKKGEKYAEIFTKVITEDFGTKNRGNKGITKGTNGYWALALPKAPALILEPFFGSNPLESDKFKDHKKYAQSINKAVNML